MRDPLSSTRVETLIRIDEFRYVFAKSHMNPADMSLLLRVDEVYKRFVYLRDEKGYRFDDNGIIRELNRYLEQIKTDPPDSHPTDLAAKIEYTIDTLTIRMLNSEDLHCKDSVAVPKKLYTDPTLALELQQIKDDAHISHSTFYVMLCDKELHDAIASFWDANHYMTVDALYNVLRSTKDDMTIATNKNLNRIEEMLFYARPGIDEWLEQNRGKIKSIKRLRQFGVRTVTGRDIARIPALYEKLTHAYQNRLFGTPEQLIAFLKDYDASLVADECCIGGHIDERVHSVISTIISECEDYIPVWTRKKEPDIA